MTRKELPARAANLQRAVSSTATCTSATVESLHAFLLPPAFPFKQAKTNVVAPSVAKKRAPPATQLKAGGARARKQDAVIVLEVAEEARDSVQPQDKYRLATEVVNSTLKTLTEAIKNPPARKKRTSLARSASNTSFNGGPNLRSQTPLQPICANKAINSPGKPGHVRRSSSTASLNQSLAGLRAQAECARLAFATLRSFQGKDGSPSLPSLQLEFGMSALIGKLIALGFDDLAIRELRILRRRLEAFSQSQGSGKSTKRLLANEDTLGSKTETLADMLRYRNIWPKGQVLTLIVTTQLQTLQILALRKESSTIEAAVAHLQLDVQHSPANLIQRQIDSDTPGSQDKAARQLENLAQLLMALCPNTSSAEDEEIGKSSHGLASETAFRIQLLSFQTRFIWWRLATHQSDIATEILDPFSRCVSALRRRSRLAKRDKYELVKTGFQTLQETIREMPNYRKGILVAVYQTLADLAQESLQVSDALRWVEDARKCAMDCGPSQTQLCSLYCRSAILQLRAHDSSDNDEVLASLRDASSSLRGKLQGDSDELDDLMVAAASLRKWAFSVFQERYRPPSGNNTQTAHLLADECSNIVLLCLSFLIKFIGSSPGRDEDQKIFARRQQRRKLASHVATPTVDSVVAMARLSSRTNPDTWANFEAGLRQCLELISRLEDPNLDSAPNADKGPSSSWFVSVSNAYWCRYLHLKQTKADTKSLKYVLRASIDTIKDRPLCERLAGLLAVKLEKYGQIHEENQDYHKAAEAYGDTINVHIHFGLLRRATEAAATRSIPAVWAANVDLEPLSRMLLAYPKLAAKAAGRNHDSKAFFDVEGLSADQRGVLLEQQLLSVSSRLLDHDPAPALHHTLTGLSNTLLVLYAKHVFPVRRLRIIVRLLGLFANIAHKVDKDLNQRVLKEEFEDYPDEHNDLGLRQFLPHMLASRHVFISMRSQSPGIKDLETVMSSWVQLLQKYPDRSSLETQVYDIANWVLQLEFMAEYLEMHGLEFLRISVLHLLVIIHEATTSMNYSILISKLSALGLQYLRLGYSNVAGLTLHKAKRYLEAFDILPEVNVQWLLSYAEYALDNGNNLAWLVPSVLVSTHADAMQ